MCSKSLPGFAFSFADMFSSQMGSLDWKTNWKKGGGSPHFRFLILNKIATLILMSVITTYSLFCNSVYVIWEFDILEKLYLRFSPCILCTYFELSSLVIQRCYCHNIFITPSNFFFKDLFILIGKVDLQRQGGTERKILYLWFTPQIATVPRAQLI